MASRQRARTGRAVTADDVARAVGLSQSTVSRAFPGAANVSAQTRERIVQAAEARLPAERHRPRPHHAPDRNRRGGGRQPRRSSLSAGARRADAGDPAARTPDAPVRAARRGADGRGRRLAPPVPGRRHRRGLGDADLRARPDLRGAGDARRPLQPPRPRPEGPRRGLRQRRERPRDGGPSRLAGAPTPRLRLRPERRDDEPRPARRLLRGVRGARRRERARGRGRRLRHRGRRGRGPRRPRAAARRRRGLLRERHHGHRRHRGVPGGGRASPRTCRWSASTTSPSRPGRPST